MIRLSSRQKQLGSCLIALLLVAGASPAFDKSEYLLKDVDQIMTESKRYLGDYTEGQSIPQPIPKLRLYEKVYRFPSSCDAELVIQILQVTGIPEDSIPPINHCMSIESAKGEIFHLYVQDSIARYIEEEYEIGDRIYLWVMWIFVNISDKKPYFLVNGLGDDTSTANMRSGGTHDQAAIAWRQITKNAADENIEVESQLPGARGQTTQ